MPGEPPPPNVAMLRILGCGAQEELADLNFLQDVCVLHLVILSYIYGHMGRGEVAQFGAAKWLKKTP